MVNGLGGPTPPPVMHGLPVPRGIAVTPAAEASPSRTTAPAPGTYAATAPAPPGAPGTQQYPPLAPEHANAFATAFEQLDTDRDGFVQGVDCFGAFMQSGLPKQLLKDIWDLVAGDAGYLNRHQFVQVWACVWRGRGPKVAGSMPQHWPRGPPHILHAQKDTFNGKPMQPNTRMRPLSPPSPQALYLIECAKRSIPLPHHLPPGQFPPVAGTVSIGRMMVSRAALRCACALCTACVCMGLGVGCVWGGGGGGGARTLGRQFPPVAVGGSGCACARPPLC